MTFVIILISVLVYALIAFLFYVHFCRKAFYDRVNCRLILFKKRNRILLAVFWPYAILSFLFTDILLFFIG